MGDEFDAVHLAHVWRCTATTGHGQFTAQLRHLIGQGLAFIHQGADPVRHICGGGFQGFGHAGQRRLLIAQPVQGLGSGQGFDAAHAGAAGAVAEQYKRTDVTGLAHMCAAA